RPNSIAAEAERAGRPFGEVLIDRMLARRLDGFFYIPIFNQDLAAVRSMLTHPSAVLGLGDSGAHTGQICDASVPTFTLAYWVRRRKVLGLEDAVKRLTFDPAMLYGIRGRGLVRRGWSADLNVIDFDRLGVREPEVRHDFPTGARHLSQRADGYLATIVNGRVGMRDGAHAGAFPGRVPRNEGGRIAVGVARGAGAGGPPVNVRRVSPRTVTAELARSALNSNEPSLFSENVLYRFDLTQRFEKDPEGALAELHQKVLSGEGG